MNQIVTQNGCFWPIFQVRRIFSNCSDHIKPQKPISFWKKILSAFQKTWTGIFNSFLSGDNNLASCETKLCLETWILSSKQSFSYKKSVESILQLTFNAGDLASLSIYNPILGIVVTVFCDDVGHFHFHSHRHPPFLSLRKVPVGVFSTEWERDYYLQNYYYNTRQFLVLLNPIKFWTNVKGSQQ